MEESELDNILRMEHRFPFKKTLQVDFENRGKQATQPLAAYVAENLEDVATKGIKFLQSFLKPFDNCELLFVEIFESRNENGDFMLSYRLLSNEDPREYEDEYFNVFFVYDETPPAPFGPIRPLKLTAGYH